MAVGWRKPWVPGLVSAPGPVSPEDRPPGQGPATVGGWGPPCCAVKKKLCLRRYVTVARGGPAHADAHPLGTGEHFHVIGQPRDHRDAEP